MTTNPSPAKTLEQLMSNGKRLLAQGCDLDLVIYLVIPDGGDKRLTPLDLKYLIHELIDLNPVGFHGVHGDTDESVVAGIETMIRTYLRKQLEAYIALELSVKASAMLQKLKDKVLRRYCNPPHYLMSGDADLLLAILDRVFGPSFNPRPYMHDPVLKHLAGGVPPDAQTMTIRTQVTEYVNMRYASHLYRTGVMSIP